MTQKERVSFTGYVTATRLQANRCNFGPQTEELLQDLIIVGVKNDYAREKLLTDAAMYLVKAIRLCKANEQASQQIKDMTTSGTKAVDAVQPRLEQGKKESIVNKQTLITLAEEPLLKGCGYCGSKHQRGNCPACGKKCNTCNRIGHFAAVSRTGKKKQRQVHALERSDCDEEMFISEIKNAKSSISEDWYEHSMSMNIAFHCGKTVGITLDTGAQCYH